MRSIFYGWCRKRLIAVTLIILGASFIILRVLQTPASIEAYVNPAPVLKLKDRDVRVYLKNLSSHITEAFQKAVRDWDKAVLEFNSEKSVECGLKVLMGCRACLTEPTLPRIRIVEDNDYDVLVESRDVMPEETIIAYTEPYINSSLLARIVVWSHVPEHRAYQVALHEIARLYGVDIPEVYRTLFGAIPAGSNTVKLNPSMEQFMKGSPDPMKVTTLDLYVAYEGLKNPGLEIVKISGIAFRAYDEPDFTIPVLTSPVLITLGLYLLSRRGWAG